MSQATKKALAASLKKLLTKKTLDKITIIDIVQDCEVNRQTFYYHFQDIYDLIEWIFAVDADKALNGKKTYDTWQQGFLQILEYAQENKSFIMNAYHSISKERLEYYLHKVTYDLLINVVEEKAVGMHVRDDDKKFIADFYKFGFVGLILEWIRGGMKEDPEEIIKHLSTLIQGDFTRALEKYRMNYRMSERRH